MGSFRLPFEDFAPTMTGSPLPPRGPSSFSSSARFRKPREKKEAQDPSRRLVLGQQAVREAIRAWGAQMFEVLVEERPGPRVQAIERFAVDQGIPTRQIPRMELERLSGGTLHQGVAAWAPPLRLAEVDDLLLDPQLLALALDGVVDPQNFGAAIRSAVGLCRAPILWPENASAPLTPATFRASAGAIEHAQLCRVSSLSGTLSQAVSAGIEVVGLAPEADVYLHEVDLTRPTILIIGSEQKGMARNVRKSCTQLVKLTTDGFVQSLNASVAAGIALHTALVQRSLKRAASIE